MCAPVLLWPCSCRAAACATVSVLMLQLKQEIEQLIERIAGAYDTFEGNYAAALQQLDQLQHAATSPARESLPELDDGPDEVRSEMLDHQRRITKALISTDLMVRLHRIVRHCIANRAAGAGHRQPIRNHVPANHWFCTSSRMLGPNKHMHLRASKLVAYSW